MNFFGDQIFQKSHFLQMHRINWRRKRISVNIQLSLKIIIDSFSNNFFISQRSTSLIITPIQMTHQTITHFGLDIFSKVIWFRSRYLQNMREKWFSLAYSTIWNNIKYLFLFVQSFSLSNIYHIRQVFHFGYNFWFSCTYASKCLCQIFYSCCQLEWQ